MIGFGSFAYGSFLVSFKFLQIRIYFCVICWVRPYTQPTLQVQPPLEHYAPKHLVHRLVSRISRLWSH